MTKNRNSDNSLCPLTGLLNCTELNRVLIAEVAHAKNVGTALSIIMIDIDHLGKFNNTYGYHEGNKLIIRLGEILKENKRAEDTIIRCNQADFSILLRNTNLNQAYQSAQRILDIVEKENFLIDDKEIKITVSAGISELSEGMNVDEFLQAAETTLRYAKKCGRNRVKGTM
jgi:diguanylate cyclase (GGDEF)-like protein